MKNKNKVVNGRQKDKTTKSIEQTGKASTGIHAGGEGNPKPNKTVDEYTNISDEPVSGATQA